MLRPYKRDLARFAPARLALAALGRLALASFHERFHTNEENESY
jgi:hypothetical protein